MEQRDTFDAIAGLYGEVRPAYPTALYDDLAAIAGLTASACVLEVGCGAGQATSELARRAGRVVALDPGPNLIEAARARTAGQAVEFTVARFEDFEAPAGSFDLIASAQAWHWIAPQISFPKAARLLRESGWLAVFGHVQTPPDGAIAEAFERAFDELAPGVWGSPHPTAGYLPSGPWEQMFDASGLFGPVIHRGYAWTWAMTPDQLGALLRTDSTYHFLPAPQRQALFDRMTAAVAAHGGRFHSRWETHVYAAPRRAG